MITTSSKWKETEQIGIKSQNLQITMSFVVDKIFEDSFYINLLLGLPKLLGNNILILSKYHSNKLVLFDFIFLLHQDYYYLIKH